MFVEYTDEHLASGADLAPLRHPLHPERSRRFSGTNPGSLARATGRRRTRLVGCSVLRRDMRLNGVERPGPLVMLAWLGRRTMGALTFRPVEGPEVPAATLVDLDRMQGEALRLLSGDGGHDLAAAQVACGPRGRAQVAPARRSPQRSASTVSWSSTATSFRQVLCRGW